MPRDPSPRRFASRAVQLRSEAWKSTLSLRRGSFVSMRPKEDLPLPRDKWYLSGSGVSIDKSQLRGATPAMLRDRIRLRLQIVLQDQRGKKERGPPRFFTVLHRQ